MIGGRPATDTVIPGHYAVSVGDPNSPLPSGWKWVLLSDVAELGTGHTPSRKHPEYWDGDIPWIGIRDAAEHHGSAIMDTAQHTNELGLANSAARLLPEGTVCLSRTASVGYIVTMGRPMATSQDFVTWSCSARLEAQYLVKALLAEGDDIRRFGKGSTHTTIYFPEAKSFHVALPPLPEQHRIVAKIDGLSAKSKRAREHLDHVPRLVEKYKQAVLAAAYVEAQRLSEHEATLGDIAVEVRNGLSKKPLDDPNGLPILRISAVRSLRVNLGDIRYYPQGEVVPATALLRDGDLLFTRYNGNPDLTAVCGMVRGLTRNTAYPDKLIRVRLSDAADPRFVEFMSAGSQSREWLAPHIKSAAGQHGISGTDLKRLPIPLPSLPPQHTIVRRIETAFAWIDRLASEATSARKLIDHLDQAILSKAFRGELVPQDPADEPASVLLERIRGERASGTKVTKRNARLRSQ